MSEIPLSQPDITPADIEAVSDVLRSGRLSGGPRTALFEQMVADRAGRRHGIAVSSGTAGLHLALVALGIGPGDEVITTPFSFIASANCILMAGATPVFVDIDPTTLNMDPDRVAAAITRRTKAIIAVEVFGNAQQIDQIARIAQHHEIPLIEDACEALGGHCHGRPVGTFGRVAVFGFYSNKQITTGEGGMMVTDDDRLATFARSLRNQGRPAGTFESHGGEMLHNNGWLEHHELGYNYRMSEMAAALGVSQMERLDAMLERRRRVAGMYLRWLMDWDDLIVPTVDRGCEEDFSWFAFVVRLSSAYGKTERDRILKGMRRHEVGAGNYFPCIHLQPFYQQRFGFRKGDFPIAESICERTIALPFHTRMDETQVELVCHTLKVMIQREQLLRR